MTQPRFRAWRFLNSAAGQARMTEGFRLSPSGGIEMVENEESIRQAILLLMSTVPGERVMRPDYGCDLQQLVFSPNDDTTAGLAMHFVRRALTRWEPRIEVLRLDANPDEREPSYLNIFLEYRIRGAQRASQLTFAFDLAGEQP